MFFNIEKKDCKSRVVNANDYEELVQKATSSFDLNPTLTFLDPAYGNILFDSQDMYRYIKERGYSY